jgi:hypothetical protein
MNWEAIGAIGELIGALAVVVTLLFLTIQIRQSTRAVRHATERGVAEDANAWRYKIIENAEVSQLFRTGLRDPEALDENDRYRFRMLLDALFTHWQHAVKSGQADAIDNANIQRILSQAGGAWYWSRSRTVGFFSAEFIDFIDARQLGGGGV